MPVPYAENTPSSYNVIAPLSIHSFAHEHTPCWCYPKLQGRPRDMKYSMVCLCGDRSYSTRAYCSLTIAIKWSQMPLVVVITSLSSVSVLCFPFCLYGYFTVFLVVDLVIKYIVIFDELLTTGECNVTVDFKHICRWLSELEVDRWRSGLER